jgi:Tol biopolymer transport system component
MGRCENAPNTGCFTTNYGTVIVDYSRNVILHHIEDTLTNASWSPDSQSLVLSIEEKSVRRDLIGDLIILDVNSGQKKQLTSDPSSDLYPSWSPDGQWIAFVRFDPDIPGCDPLPSSGFINEKCNQGSLYMIRPDGSGLQLLFEPIFIFNNDAMLMQVIDNAPAWSPDSRWLAFLTRNESGLPNHSTITIVNIETGEWQLVGAGSLTSISPAWSPDGKKLAFASNRDGGDFDIYLLDLDENSIVNLTQTDIIDCSPVWSLSGAHIAYISGYDLAIMYADGTNKVYIDEEDIGMVLGIPVWQPSLQPTQIQSVGLT